MRDYIAAYLNDNGKVALNTQTNEIVQMPLGSFPSFDAAVEHACEVLESRIIGEGTLHRDAGFGGFLICNEPQFESLKQEVLQND